MFELLIVKPLFNLLVLIYALLPGHNFGLALVIFTVIIRFLMWPLVRKQLHQARVMRQLQPEIKRIKQTSKGNRQMESMMLMELYKERGVSLFGNIGVLIVQVIILLGLYSGLSRLINDPQVIVSYSYDWVSNLGWIKDLAADISKFDATLFGIVDLTRSALPRDGGGVYLPALVLVLGSAVMQYYQSKQLLPKDKDARSLRKILREAGTGKQADQGEIQAATSRNMVLFIPLLIIIFTVGLASALALYWFVSGAVAYWQQDRLLKQDEAEMEAIADAPSKKEVIEGEVIPSSKRPKKKKATSKTKRRKR